MNSGSLILIVAMFALLWFLLIRPQRQRQAQQQQLLDSVAPGDEVLTVGGLYGIVQEIEEDGDLVVEVAEGIHVRIAKRAVAGVEKPEDEEGEGDAEGEEDEEAEEPNDGDEGEQEAPADEGDIAAREESVSDAPADADAAIDPR